MAEKRGKREKVVNPSTGRLVYADGPAGRCAKALEALARRLGGKASPPKKTALPSRKTPAPAPKKGILKAPKTSADRGNLRNRWISRVENAPKTVANERAYDKIRGNRSPAYETPTQAQLDVLTLGNKKLGERMKKSSPWKMPAGEATRRREKHEEEAFKKKLQYDPRGEKIKFKNDRSGSKWKQVRKEREPTAKVKWYEKSGPDPLVADGWKVRKDAPVKGVRTLQGGKARSNESAERRRVAGGRRKEISKHIESLHHEFDRFSPGGLWYPTRLTSEYNQKLKENPTPPPPKPKEKTPTPPPPKPRDRSKLQLRLNAY